MCGIVGYIGTKKAVPVLINGLLSLEYRGYDSAGLAVLNPKKDNFELKVAKEKGRVKNLQEDSSVEKLVGTVGIAHTRWATHGAPSKTNAHPHLDNSKTFAVVHNGIIENYDDIKEFLGKKGYTLISDTDTEVIPNLIHYYFTKKVGKAEDKFLAAVSMAVKKLEGSFAIEVITPLFPNRIVVAKKDSPMVIGKGSSENFIASDIPAVLNYTKQFYFMEDFEIANIESDKITFYDFDLNKINKKVNDIEWDAVASEKNGYEDYMLKEIFEQPKTIRETIGTALAKASAPIKLNLDGLDFSKFNKIYIIACGTAMHAGIATKYIFEKYSKISTDVDMASEFRYRNPLIDKKTLCIFISQSGETADTIAALKLAKSCGATTLSIVNVIGSSITRVADFVLYTHAGPEIAVASTKAYTCQVTLLSILALYVFESLSAKDSKGLKRYSDEELKSFKKEVSELKKEITELPDKVAKTLKSDKLMKEIAESFYTKKDIFFIGRGTDYAVALEGSLKLKEISYIHSEAQAAGELKHGPIALIEKGVPVIGIATSPDISAKTMSNLEEVITRGANVRLITNQKIESSVIDNSMIVKIPDCSAMISPILSVIPMQLFAYYVAKTKKLDVDKPRNLAKSVTVE